MSDKWKDWPTTASGAVLIGLTFGLQIWKARHPQDAAACDGAAAALALLAGGHLIVGAKS